MSPDYSKTARTAADREYAYLAYGMLAGAVPGVLAGLLLSLVVGNAPMWVSVVGGAGIVLGLIGGVVAHRRAVRREQAHSLNRS